MMDAIHLLAPNGSGRPELVLRHDTPVPVIADDEVLVEVRACGVCGTDFEACSVDDTGRTRFGGPLRLPVILGHEISGVVERCGRDVTGLRTGTPVALRSVLGCGSCVACAAGLGSQCRDANLVGLTRSGGFAELVAVPARACFATDALSDLEPASAHVAGSLLEPLACAHQAIAVAAGGVAPGSAVVVHGLGSLGTLTGLLARVEGAEPVVGVDPVAERRDWALSLGFDACVAPAPRLEESRDAVLQALGGRRPAIQVDATGVDGDCFPLVEALLAPLSRCISMSRKGSRRSGIGTDHWVTASASLVFTRGQAAPSEYPRLVELLRDGRLPVDRLVTARRSLPEIVAMLRRPDLREAGKTVFVPAG